MTSIPVYIWKQRCWLPYADELDWTSFAVVVEAAQMQKAKRRVFDLPANEIQEIQARIAKLYQKYFSYDGVCAYIRRKMEAIPDREPAEAVTAGRDQF
jgi:hypothetical protein